MENGVCVVAAARTSEKEGGVGVPGEVPRPPEGKIGEC